MRPLYETEEDKSREAAVCNYICSSYNAAFVKSEDLSAFDGVFTQIDGSPIAVAEVKIRSNDSRKYPTYMISATKVDRILDYANANNVFPMLVVGFTDGVFMTKLDKKYPRASGGRRDRNDPRDIEACVFIPMEKFKLL